jgi:hypothetical protein
MIKPLFMLLLNGCICSITAMEGSMFLLATVNETLD